MGLTLAEAKAWAHDSREAYFLSPRIFEEVRAQYLAGLTRFDGVASPSREDSGTTSILDSVEEKDQAHQQTESKRPVLDPIEAAIKTYDDSRPDFDSIRPDCIDIIKYDPDKMIPNENLPKWSKTQLAEYNWYKYHDRHEDERRHWYNKLKAKLVERNADAVKTLPIKILEGGLTKGDHKFLWIHAHIILLWNFRYVP